MFYPDIRHVYLESPAAASQHHSQRREILRPPPFPNFNSETQQSSLGPKDENDGNIPVRGGKYFDHKKVTLLWGFH